MSLTPEHVLEHGPFLRGLARSLLRDAARADDVVQEAWMAALRRPHEVRDLRPWLVGTVRNLVRRDKRSAGRRQAREERAGMPATARDPADVIETEEARRQLVDALLALDEPYRTPLLLRYYDDLPPREIARRLGVPGSTVRTRIQRGLEQLRTELDATHGGDRRAWCLAILPLALDPRAGAAVAGSVFTGALSMKIQVSALVLAICACVFLLFQFGQADAPTRGQPVGRESMTGPEIQPGSIPKPEADSERPRASDATSSVIVRGTVRVDGLESAQVSVTVRSQDVVAASVVTEREFAIALAAEGLPETLEVTFEHPQAQTETRSLTIRDRTVDALDVTLQRVSITRGVVLAETAEPAEGVTVAAFRMDREDPEQEAATTGTARPDGTFELRIPGEGPHLIVAVAKGYQPHGKIVDVTLEAPTELEPISLLRGEHVTGRVLLVGSGPVRGAEVRAEWPGSGIDLFIPGFPDRPCYTDGRVTHRIVNDRTAADGTYELRGLMRTSYDVALMSIPNAHHGLTAGVANREPEYETRVQAPRAGVDFEVAVATIDIRVRANGEPLKGAKITLTQSKRSPKGASKYSNSIPLLGTNRLRRHVSPGVDLKIRVESEGMRAQERRLRAPDAGRTQTFVFDMEPAQYGSLRVTLDPVADPAPPAPPRMKFALQPLPEGDVIQKESAPIDGKYVVSGIVPGRHKLTAYAGRQDYYFPVSAEIAVQPDTELPLVLRPRVGGRLHVLYVTKDGRTDRSAFVKIVFPNGKSSTDLRIFKGNGSGEEMWANSLPNVRGPGKIGRVLEPGVYRVLLEPYDEDAEKLEREVRIEAGKTAVAEFRE